MCYYFGSGWYLVRLWVRFTIGQMYPPGRDIGWPSVILLLVRLTFGQIYPQTKTSCGQVWYYSGSGWHLVRSSGQVDLWLDVPPGRDILWPSMVLLWVRLTFGEIFRSGWHWSMPTDRDILLPSVILLWVRLTFGQIFRSGWPLVRCTPRQRHLVAKYGTTLSQVDFWWDLQVSLTLVKWSHRQRHLVARCYYFGSGLHLVRSSGRLTFGQMYPQGRDILWPSVIPLWVRLTFGQISGSGWHWSNGPPDWRHLFAKCDTTFGQVDIWSDLWIRLTFGQMDAP